MLGDRRYRIRGLNKNLAFDVLLKVNVLVARGDAFHGKRVAQAHWSTPAHML
jgi:hypothetical protein